MKSPIDPAMSREVFNVDDVQESPLPIGREPDDAGRTVELRPVLVDHGAVPALFSHRCGPSSDSVKAWRRARRERVLGHLPHEAAHGVAEVARC
jgi:hypothetical protein